MTETVSDRWGAQIQTALAVVGGDPPPTVAGILASVAGSTFVVGDIGAIVKNGYRFFNDYEHFSYWETAFAGIGILTTQVPGADQSVGILRAVVAAAGKRSVSGVIGAFVQAGFKNAKDTVALAKHAGNLVKLAKAIVQSDDAVRVFIDVVNSSEVFQSALTFIKNTPDTFREVVWPKLKTFLAGQDGVVRVQQLLHTLGGLNDDAIKFFSQLSAVDANNALDDLRTLFAASDDLVKLTKILNKAELFSIAYSRLDALRDMSALTNVDGFAKMVNNLAADIKPGFNNVVAALKGRLYEVRTAAWLKVEQGQNVTSVLRLTTEGSDADIIVSGNIFVSVRPGPSWALR